MSEAAHSAEQAPACMTQRGSCAVLLTQTRVAGKYCGGLLPAAKVVTHIMELEQILSGGLSVPPREYSPLALAFIGDAVYELFVRAHVLAEANASAHVLHRKAVTYVKAHAQAEAAKKLMECLNDDEMAVFKRGRNAKSSTVPKNADVTDYRYATALEALLGYLFLSGETMRLNELMAMAYDCGAPHAENDSG